MAASFDALLQADRQKRKHEQLANQLLGKGRRSSTPSNGVRKAGTAGNLANRIAFANRSFSAMPKVHVTPKSLANAQPQHVSTAGLAHNSRPVRENPMARKAQKERLSENLNKMDWDSSANGQATVRNGGEISILGAAGPYTVVGSNFAPGTTAADIESAMAPIGGEMLDCQITSQKPTVVAEMVFSEKARAENVIATFNNKRADGRLLHVYLKVGKPTSPSKPQSSEPPRNIEHVPKEAPRDDCHSTEIPSSEPPRNAPSEPKASRIDLTHEETSYSKQREQSDRNRRRAEPEFQDGSYGFEKKEDRMDVDNDDRRGFYSDRQRHYERSRDPGRPRESERRLYSDDLYPRHSRGRGFR